ncbi:phosphotransferase family protein [Paenibacillus dauci]|uniref:phosphotransferase family protein n=1 Tax=Paenibacillus dauci TaxID=1567106 RepID=UPI000619FA22|nr:phosphotransferase [Paenibacillus dauci]
MANDILLRKFQNIQITELTGGYTNQTLLLEGSTPLVVAKIFDKNNDDAKIEAHILALLNDSGVTPKMYDHFEDDSSSYIIMDYIHGINGQRFLDQGNMDKAKAIYKLLGEHLSREIHTIKQKKSHLELPMIKLAHERFDELYFIPSDVKDRVKEILDTPIEKENTLIHGDFGPHNTIVSDDSMVVIDWEWGGWGHPLQDIAWVLWFVHFHYPEASNELSEIFLNTYREHSTIQITEEGIKAFALSRVIHILNRIKNANTNVKEEWLRRLEWTLKRNFVG